MFSKFRKETPSLQLYGKLPLAKDYLRVGGSQGVGRAFRDWLDQDFSSMAARASAPQFPWPLRFLVVGQDGDPLLGSGWPSSDQGGERPFPFVAFIERRKKALASAVAAGFEELTDQWVKIEACYAAHQNFGDGESFLTAMRGQEIEVEAKDGASDPARVDLASWTETLWPGDGQEGLVRTLASLAGLATHKQSGPVRLPLVGDLSAAPQVHAWWSALVDMRLIEPGGLLTVFFARDGEALDEPAFVTFFPGRLEHGDSAWLSSARGQANLGTGDYCSGHTHLAGQGDPVGEHTPSLAESMKGAVASARARS